MLDVRVPADKDFCYSICVCLCCMNCCVCVCHVVLEVAFPTVEHCLMLMRCV